jgi:hypothetical protein
MEKPWETLEDFEEWFRNQQEDIDPEFQKVFDDNFWELILSTNKEENQ